MSIEAKLETEDERHELKSTTMYSFRHSNQLRSEKTTSENNHPYLGE